MLAQSSEFSQVAVREEELPELDELARTACPHEVKGGVENSQGKVSILLQVNSRKFILEIVFLLCVVVRSLETLVCTGSRRLGFAHRPVDGSGMCCNERFCLLRS